MEPGMMPQTHLSAAWGTSQNVWPWMGPTCECIAIAKDTVSKPYQNSIRSKQQVSNQELAKMLSDSFRDGGRDLPQRFFEP
jgi:hypothetical protein